jgi:hypothetical protein
MEKAFVLLGDLAEVLGESANTIGQMFKRGGFTLPDANPRGGTGNWTQFTLQDVAVIALIRAMTNLGMQTRTASEAVQYVIEQRVELGNLDEFIARWRSARLVVSRSEKSWHFMVFEGDDDLGGPSAYITLNIAKIVDDALSRARRLAKRHQRRRA